MYKKITSYTKKVDKYEPEKGVHTAYAKELSTAIPSSDVRSAWVAARKCKEEAIRTSDAVWGAIHHHHPNEPIPKLRIDS